MSDALRQADGFRLGTRPSDGDVDQANRLIDALSARLAALEADLAAQEAVAPVSVPEAAKVLLDATNEDSDLDDVVIEAVAEEAEIKETEGMFWQFLAALRALAETESRGE